MAHIFKYPSRKSKGIIVLTHKEYKLFLKSQIKTFNFLKKRRAETEKRKLINMLNNLKEHYYIGVHWGMYQSMQKSDDSIDFNMASKSTVLFDDEKIANRISLQSRNFIPEALVNKYHTEEKYWDILSIFSPRYLKNIHFLMREVRKIFDLGYKLKILFIVYGAQKNEDSSQYVTELFQWYYEQFSNEERNYFTILKMSYDTGMLGMSQEQLFFYYKKSKVFTLFTQAEGESRVISEALLSGNIVVVKDDLIGGGRDYLDIDNSIQFSDYNKAYKALIYAVENYKEMKTTLPREYKQLLDTYSLEKLKFFFKELYEKNGEDFDGKLININSLDRRLPAHYAEVEFDFIENNLSRYMSTMDLLTIDKLRGFFEHLLEKVIRD